MSAENTLGKLIVFDGTDSSGKETQAKRFALTVLGLGYEVAYLDFPRYQQFHGKVVGEYLAGNFGDVDNVHPKLISYAYACDRAARKDQLREWREKGMIIVCNRYIPSNLAFMSAKLPEDEREEFIKWEEELEYKQLGLPKEDFVFFLHVPPRYGQELTYKKGEKVYMKGKGAGDIHERNLLYLEKAVGQYRWLSENRENWAIVECVNSEGKLRTRKNIYQEIMDIARSRVLTS